MNRYRALRFMQCDPFTAGFIALLNWARGYPANEIHFLSVVIEIEPAPAAELGKDQQ